MNPHECAREHALPLKTADLDRALALLQAERWQYGMTFFDLCRELAIESALYVHALLLSLIRQGHAVAVYGDKLRRLGSRYASEASDRPEVYYIGAQRFEDIENLLEALDAPSAVYLAVDPDGGVMGVYTSHAAAARHPGAHGVNMRPLKADPPDVRTRYRLTWYAGDPGKVIITMTDAAYHGVPDLSFLRQISGFTITCFDRAQALELFDTKLSEETGAA